MNPDSAPLLAVGQRVQVVTHDGHMFRARVVDIRRRKDREDEAVLRFDTGWVTSYPVSMVKPVDAPENRSPAIS